MTNPFQQGGSGGFFDNDYTSTGLPAPIGQRRWSSYGSMVSGAAALSAARNSRTSGFSHLLNPSPDEVPSNNNLYSTGRYQDYTGGSGRTDAAGGDHAGWAPRVSSSLPSFSRAFEMFTNKDPLTLDGDDFSAGLGYPGNFILPSYLRGSVYLNKLQEQHRAKILAHRESQTQGAPQSGSLQSNGNGLSLHGKLPPAHRGGSFELIGKTFPLEGDEDFPSPLPSKWNKDDKSANLEVLGEGFEVKHTGSRGSGDRDHEACAIRADHYMPSQCGVYYFEVIILNRKRDESMIGIGFSSKTVSLSRAPGWEPESWGYHGDDGHCFAAQTVGKSYGPKFGPGDTVGCLVNFRLGQALFTRNGIELPIAFRDVNFRDVKGKLYPTVGLKRPGDHVFVNFGQLPFQYDIDRYVKMQQQKIEQEINETDTSFLAPGLKEHELVEQLVLQFLQHDGYVETARAFAEELRDVKMALRQDPHEEIPGINIKDDEDARNRQRIRRAILEGDVDKALKYTNSYYPQVLKENEQVYFRLRCRKFVEMIRKDAELNLLVEQRAAKARSAAATGDLDEIMLEADGSAYDDQMDTDAEVSKLLQEALEYGQELRNEFGKDRRKEVTAHLEEIFALMAYQNPLKEKEVKHLLDRSGRVAVAEELNSAILRSLGKSSRSALENMYAQTVVLLEMLREDGGPGAFVDVQQIIDRIPKANLD
ncbi:ran-binding protein [Thozetella sp. PMI_491]|nr:ran-binding protein [Thozetella sp. PMI_491]